MPKRRTPTKYWNTTLKEYVDRHNQFTEKRKDMPICPKCSEHILDVKKDVEVNLDANNFWIYKASDYIVCYCKPCNYTWIEEK